MTHRMRSGRWTALLLFALVCSSAAFADGGFFSRPTSTLKLAAVSADQRAILVRKGSATSMILSTAYSGNGEDFAWIIPTPAPATVSEAGMEGEAAFQLFDTITAVKYTVWGSTEGIRGSLDSNPQEPRIAPVTVHDQVTLEHFEASVLSARGAGPLLDWLEQNSYRVDLAAASVLNEYIRQGWSFVVIKPRPRSAWTGSDGYLPPVLITYRSDRFVFPLRISSVSSSGTVVITLYAVAESTVSVANPGAYGNAVVSAWRGRYEDRLFTEVRGKMAGESVIEMPWLAWTIGELTGIAFAHDVYLTRLEARLASPDLFVDIDLELDPQPREFIPPQTRP